MRLIPASSAAAQKPAKDRTTPGTPSEVEANRTSSDPKNAARAAAAAPLKELCPDVYAGNGGVTSSGDQPGSSPSRTAVTGRQTSKRNLHSQHTTPASAIATLSSAKRRALSAR